jgi:hypothetical protein
VRIFQPFLRLGYSMADFLAIASSTGSTLSLHAPTNLIGTPASTPATTSTRALTHTRCHGLATRSGNANNGIASRSASMGVDAGDTGRFLRACSQSVRRLDLLEPRKTAVEYPRSFC